MPSQKGNNKQSANAQPKHEPKSAMFINKLRELANEFGKKGVTKPASFKLAIAYSQRNTMSINENEVRAVSMAAGQLARFSREVLEYYSNEYKSNPEFKKNYETTK